MERESEVGFTVETEGRVEGQSYDTIEVGKLEPATVGDDAEGAKTVLFPNKSFELLLTAAAEGVDMDETLI